ncbi:Ig-like domain-containing protein [Cellulomonas endometrii]|uniref:Ig-like domain-containing protein n=1 Tax=Cellulomonas endometrii TaxID=3036301 RepID=UPI0024AE1916|nr:Ig-like domain-containing protein [Cellulomonas endometrii]
MTTPAHGAGSVGVGLATVLRDGTTPGPDLTVPGAFLYVVPPPAPAPRAASASHVRGTGPAGTDVVIRDGLGTTVGTAPVAADGSFDVALAPAQAHGATLTVTAVDSHGIPSAPATVTVDAVAPAAPAIGPTDGSVLRGTAEPGSLVTVRSGSRGVVASVTAGADGSWSLAPAPALPRGDRAAADARDVAGNVSPEAARRVGLPVVPADQTLTTGTTGQVTATDLQPGERVAASLFSEELRLGEATADADGVVTFTVALTAGFAPGAHELVLTGPASGQVTGSIRVLAATGTAGTGTDPGSGGTAGAGGAPGPGAAVRGHGARGLAWTGAETGTALAGAAALIALGGVLVRSRRAAAGTPPR